MQVSACCDVVQVTPTSTSVLHLSQGFIKPLLRTSPEWSARATWTNNSSGTGSLVGRGLKTGLELCETNTESCERQGAGHREKGNTEKPCLWNWGRSAKCSWRSRCLSWDWREEKVFFRWQVRWSGGAEVWGVGDCTGCCLPARLCSPLCDPVDCSPPGFSVHGILQARILAWVAVYLLQGISLTQGSRLHLLLGRWILYHWASREAWDCTYTGCTSNRTLSLQELFWVSAGEGSWASKQVLGQKVSRQLR